MLTQAEQKQLAEYHAAIATYEQASQALDQADTAATFRLALGATPDVQIELLGELQGLLTATLTAWHHMVDLMLAVIPIVPQPFLQRRRDLVAALGMAVEQIELLHLSQAVELEFAKAGRQALA